MTVETAPLPAGPDPTRIEQVAGTIFAAYTGGMLTYMIDIAHRTGLLTALASGPGTSTEIARRAGLAERYVRECLGALVVGGLVGYEPDTSTYVMSAEQAACLTGDGSLNVAPYSRVSALLARHVDAVADCFYTGGGVPYERYRPEFTDVMDSLGRGLYDTHLIDGILPLAGDTTTRLATGARVADIGCGTGHTTNLLAQAFPASEFIGFDLAPDAIARARQEAAGYGLTNATFEVQDVAQLPTTPPFDVVVAFDAIHDQTDPAGVLARIYAALEPGGAFLMFDINAASRLEDNIGNPLAAFLYSVSTLHCMTVSLAESGAGLGTVWGRELALSMLADAGFADVSVHEVPDDPLDLLYCAHKRP